MDIFVMDETFRLVSIIDNYISFIWTDRYCGYGEFELYQKVTIEALTVLVPDYYLFIKESDHIMIIEDIRLKDDAEDGHTMIVTGRSAESILDRRVIGRPVVIQDSLQNGIKKLLNENAINPVVVGRKIPNLIFEDSIDVSVISLITDTQYAYENLYDVVETTCSTNDLGFKITLSDDNKFVFKLYSGVDRSYNQITNPYVIFSPSFDNLISGDYRQSQKNYKNVALVAGEGDDAVRELIYVGSSTGLARRETYTDASSVTKTVDGKTLTATEYTNQLTQKGIEDLYQLTIDAAFEGQVDASVMFKYGEDFQLGDIVQLVDSYGIESSSRITEVIISQDENGKSIYPTFTMIQ